MNLTTMHRSYTVVYTRYDKEIETFKDVNQEMLPALIPAFKNEKIELNGETFSVKKVVRKISADDNEINIIIEIQLSKSGDMEWC